MRSSASRNLRSSGRRACGAARGVLLLEVVVALTIMVAAMGVLGAQLVSGLRMVAYADEQARAAEMADRMMALLELDLKYAEQLAIDAKLDGDFGKQHPGFFWHVHIEPTDVDGLGKVTLQILQQRDTQNLDSADGATVVRELHFLKAAPAKIDLAADFGFNEEQLTTITSTIPLPGISDGKLDVPKLVEALTADPSTLISMLPQLMQIFAQVAGGAGASNTGGGPSVDMMRELMAEQIQAAMGGDALGGGQDAPPLMGDQVQDAGDLLELRDRMFGPDGQGGGRPVGGRGNRGGGRGPGGGAMDAGGGMPGGGEFPTAGVGGNRGGGRTGGGRTGGNRSGGNQPGLQRQPGAGGLEELMRLRDEFNRRQRDGG